MNWSHSSSGPATTKNLLISVGVFLKLQYPLGPKMSSHFWYILPFTFGSNPFHPRIIMIPKKELPILNPSNIQRVHGLGSDATNVSTLPARSRCLAPRSGAVAIAPRIACGTVPLRHQAGNMTLNASKTSLNQTSMIFHAWIEAAIIHLRLSALVVATNIATTTATAHTAAATVGMVLKPPPLQGKVIHKS